MSSQDPSATDLLRAGMAHHRAGRSAEAAKCYARALDIAPGSADGLHLLAVALHQLGEPDRARGLFERAIALAPSSAAYRNNFGNLLRDAGEAEAAEAEYRAAVEMDPAYAQAWGNLAVVQFEGGAVDEAETSARKALSLNPEAPESAVALARIRMHKGALDEAGRILHDCVSRRPRHGAARHHYANYLIEIGEFKPALAQAEAAVGFLPGSAKARSTLGAVLMKIGELDESIKRHAEAHAMDPRDPYVAYNYANALLEADRPTEAEAAYREALKAKPDYPDALSNLGNALHRLGRPEEAERSYGRAVALRPDAAMSHFNLAVMLLSEGRYREGFEEYEWRWETPGRKAAKRPFEQPIWEGGRGDGETLLLHCEQGFGDSIMFARFAARAKEAFGGRVILEAYRPLQRLFESLAGPDEVVTQGAEPPPFDTHAPLMSLPRILGIELDEVAMPAPYLTAPRGSDALGAAMADDRYGIGIVWSGNPTQKNNAARAIPLRDLLAALDGLPAAAFSLQVGAGAEDLERIEGSDRVVDLSARLTDFSETAAAIARLDLVMTVDTAAAHLAGALGVPAWVLLHEFPAWQWILRPNADGEPASPWYPGLRVLRKRPKEDWRDLLDRARRDLDRLIAQS